MNKFQPHMVSTHKKIVQSLKALTFNNFQGNDFCEISLTVKMHALIQSIQARFFLILKVWLPMNPLWDVGQELMIEGLNPEGVTSLTIQKVM